MRILAGITVAMAVMTGLFAPPSAGAAEPAARLAIIALDAGLHGERLRIGLALSRPTGFDVFTLDTPRRLVVDLPALDWRAGEAMPPAPYLTGLRRGLFRPGEARLIFDLARPVRIERAFTLPAAPGRDPRLVIDLTPTDAESFAAAAGWPVGRRWTGATGPERGVLVALDPGHGGHDPGAMVEGLVEKDLVMAFARDLAQAITARPGLDAVLTRDDDGYVPLAVRIDRARTAGADLMISLHADRLARGRAEGISVYSLGRAGGGAGPDAAELVRGPARASLIGGSRLEGESDALAETLVDLARRDTGPASEALARALVAALDGTVAVLDKRPHRHGSYAVLKAADLPAVLVELGFLDNARDRRRLETPGWRARTIGAIIVAVEAWDGMRRAAGPESADRPMQDRNSRSGETAMTAATGTTRHRGTFAMQQTETNSADLTR